jgi:beta-lactamase regulating signal transducer with metallopeptidase domain
MTGGVGLPEWWLLLNLRVMLLLGLVWALVSCLRRLPDAPARHDIWLIGIAGCALLPLLNAALPTLDMPLLPAVDRPAAESPAGNPLGPASSLRLPPELSPNAAGSPVPQSALSQSQSQSPDAVSRSVAAIGPAAADDPRALAGLWPRVLVYLLAAIYLAGVFWRISAYLLALRRVAELGRRLAAWDEPAGLAMLETLRVDFDIGRRVRLGTSSAVGSPVTFGVFRPVIVLPAAAYDWTEDCLRNVLLHELCHIRRADWLRLAVQRIVGALYWFNPCVLLAIRQCAYEAERACDDGVLRRGGDPADYAGQLLAILASKPPAQLSGVGIGDGHLARRISAILDTAKETDMISRHAARIAIWGAGVAILATAAVGISSAQPAAEPPAQVPLPGAAEPPAPATLPLPAPNSAAVQALPERSLEPEIERLRREIAALRAAAEVAPEAAAVSQQERARRQSLAPGETVRSLIEQYQQGEAQNNRLRTQYMRSLFQQQAQSGGRTPGVETAPSDDPRLRELEQLIRTQAESQAMLREFYDRTAQMQELIGSLQLRLQSQQQELAALRLQLATAATD